jgi:hypothetical protein
MPFECSVCGGKLYGEEIEAGICPECQAARVQAGPSARETAPRRWGLERGPGAGPVVLSGGPA